MMRTILAMVVDSIIELYSIEFKRCKLISEDKRLFNI